MKTFLYAVKNHYWYQMYLDDLPIWGMVGELAAPEPEGSPVPADGEGERSAAGGARREGQGAPRRRPGETLIFPSGRRSLGRSVGRSGSRV